MMNKQIIEEKTQRFLYLDILRVVAAAAVIIGHASTQNWYKSSLAPVDSIMWQSFNFYDGIVRWCVPLFLMISGALFLSREDIPVKKIYSKYVARIAAAYFIWSFIYFLFGSRGNGGIFTRIMGGYVHLWYLKMIIGVYICLPVIKQIIKNPKTTKYYQLLSLIFYCTVPLLNALFCDFAGENVRVITDALWQFAVGMRMSFVMSLIFYFILGYQLFNAEFSKRTRIAVYILGILGAVFTVAANSAVSLINQKCLQNYMRCMYLNITFQAAAVFVFFKYTELKNQIVCKIIRKLSEWSFGAYLVHMLVLEQLARCGIDTLSMPPFVSVPVIAIIVFVGSFAASAVLNCVPVLKKYML